MNVSSVGAKLLVGVAAAGLVILGAGPSAADPSATGTFTYGRTMLIDPAPGVCYTVDKSVPGPELARNGTDSPVVMFASAGCTGAPSVLGAGQSQFIDIQSMKFG